MDMPMPERAPEPQPAVPLKLTWKHPAGLFGLSVVNFLLRIVTLGIYGFWAKTEVRKRIWSAVRIEGEPLHYTGTGKELLLGFVVVFFVVLLPVLVATSAVIVAFGPESTTTGLYQMSLYAFFFLLSGVAIYRAQRYRLSRTTWRSIRGSLTGSANAYAWTYFWTGLVSILTLGWALPWRATKLQELMLRDMKFGNQPFHFSASSRPLYVRFAVLWMAVALVAGMAVIAAIALVGPFMAEMQLGPDGAPKLKLPPEIGGAIFAIALAAFVLYAVFGAWYRAHQMRHFATHTHFDDATFESTVTARGFIWVAVTNVFIVVGTFGLLSPIAQARTARYMVRNLAIGGKVRVAEIAQGADQKIGLGEGLAQAFDIDAF